MSRFGIAIRFVIVAAITEAIFGTLGDPTLRTLLEVGFGIIAFGILISILFGK